MIKKLVIGGTAAGLVLAGAASAAQLKTDGVAGKTLAAGDVTVSGAVLEDISFGTAWSQDFSSGSEGLHEHGGTVSTKDGIGIVNGSVFTRFGGYTTTSAGTWKASVDVYLDPTADTQFDYTVAANNAAKGHVQDFIFHAANTDTGLAIGASNNTDSKPVPGKTEYTVPEAGWYTLQHEFRADAEGHLVVDMTVVKDGKTAWTKSIKSKDDGKDVVFAETGHRYGWFTFTTGDLRIDNMSLTSAEPQEKVETITVDVDKPGSWVVASFDGFTSEKVQTSKAGVAVIDIPATSIGSFTGPIHLVVTS